MASFWSGIGVATCTTIAALAGPVLAQAPERRPAGTEIWASEICLQGGDAAFEQALRDDVTEDDRAVLSGVVQAATYECLGLSMEMCERTQQAEACLSDLAAWLNDARAAIVAQLPDTLDSEDVDYTGLLAVAGSDEGGGCAHLNAEQSARYCAVISEGVALEAAYGAWRIARLTGEMALEGHAPIDLELIR